MRRRYANAMGYLVVATCLLAAAGCRVKYFRAETVIEPDGRIRRAIYQPQEDTPQAARESPLWQKAIKVREVAPQDWSGSITELSAAPADTKNPYFAAWGEFDSAEQIPAHFRKETPDGKRAGELVRRYQPSDYGLVVQHRWEETLTDVVTLDDMHKALRELAQLLIGLQKETLQQELGPDYDVEPLITWMRTEGVVWFEELADVLYEVRAARPPNVDEVLKERVLEVCRRHGLEALSDEAIEDFATEKLRRLIRHKQNRPLDQATIDELLGWLGPRKESGKEQKANRFRQRFEALAAERFGSQEAFQKRMEALVVRILGVYGLVDSPLQFDYSLQMPGFIVETTGTLTSENTVEWSFRANQAYPLGYRMTAVSLASKPDVQRRVFGRLVLKDRRSEIEFVRLLAQDADLHQAMLKAIEQGSPAPLESYRQTILRRPPNQRREEEARIKRLWRLLGLPL